MAVTEEVADTPLEIVAFSGNLKAFDLIAPHYEDNIKKQIAQLLIWALTDKTPSAAFMLLFESVPMAEVQCFMILKVIRQGPQVNSGSMLGYNLLQILALQGNTSHLAFLLEQG